MQPRSALQLAGGYEAVDLSDKGIRIRSHRNESPLPPPEHVINAIRLIDANWLRYYPTDAQRRVLKLLAMRLNLRTSEVALANGADEIILALARSFLEPRDNLIVSRPTFGMYRRAGILAGAEVREVAYQERWRLDVDALLAQRDERTKLIILGHPNNPTGDLLGVEQLERISSGAPNALVVVDEIYLSFKPSSLVSRVRSLDNVAVIGSLSKVSAMAGLRIGYLVASKPVARAARSSTGAFPISAPALAAAAAYLCDDAATCAFESALTRVVDRSLNRIVEVLQPFSREYWRGLANFVLVDLGIDTSMLVRKLRRRGIGVRHFSDPILQGCLRFSAVDDQATVELTTTLRELLPQHLARGLASA